MEKERDNFEGLLNEEERHLVHEDETVEDLQLKGLRMIQKREGFRFGTDAVILSHFTQLRNRESVMDLCTGSGIVPVLFAGKTESMMIRGLEIQEPYADMASRNVALNRLDERVRIYKGDLRDSALIESLGKFSVVTANPPYKKNDMGVGSADESLRIARHEVTMNLEDLILASSTLLKDQGRLCLVHRPERLLDIVTGMRRYGIEPKRIRMVAPKRGKAPNIMLIEGIKGARPYLKWESELVMYDNDGRVSEEVRNIYDDGHER